MKNILFVCTGNSCRSQMAEGFGKYLSNGQFDIKSAGIAPIGVHPMAVASMREIGIDISDQCSTMLDSGLIRWADYVITLCNSARDNCPVIPGGIRHIHWDIENPDRVCLSDKDRRDGFAGVRDELKKRIEKLFDEIK